MGTASLNQTSRNVRNSVVAAFAMTLSAVACASPEDRLERYIASGSEFLESGKLGLANVQYLNALKIDEENTVALQGLASIAERRGEYEQMFGILQRISRLDPSNERVRLDLAKLYLLSNDTATALDLVDRVIETSPKSAAAYAVKSAIMFRLQNNADAVEFAKMALAIEPKTQEAIAVLVSERVLSKDFEGALKILDEAIARDAQASVLHLLRVQVLTSLGRTDDINAAYATLISEFPNDANFRRLYATTLIAQDRLDEARAQLVEVVRLLPRQQEAKLDVVRIDYRIGGKTGAESTLREFATRDDGPEMIFALGSFLREEGDFAAAEKVYESVIATRGEELAHVMRAKNEMAALRMLEGKRPEAEKLIAEIIAADSKNPDALLKRAGLRIDDGGADDAIGDLRIVLNERPESIPARLLLGAAFEQKGDLTLAENEFAKAVETSAAAAQPSLIFAKFLLRKGNRARAEKVLTASVGANSSAAENLKLLAAIRLENQDWRGAEAAAKALRAVDTTDGDVSRILSAAYTGLNDYAGAIEILTTEHERSPLEARPLAALIQAYLDAGRISEAERFLARTIESNPAQYEPRVLLAQVQRAQKRSDEAIAMLKAAIALEPLRSEAYEALYGVHVLDGRRAEAGALIDQAVSAIPDHDGLQILKADHLIAIDQSDAAINIYETIFARRPNDLIVANNLASLLLERDDVQSVARAAAAAEALKGADNAYFLDTYGWALYRSGRIAEGVAALEKAVEKAPDLIDARYHLGVALVDAGDKDRGRAELQTVVDAPSADPDRVSDARRRLKLN